VAVSGRLILVNGIGSLCGPLIDAALMMRLEIDGVFYFMAAPTSVLALVAGLGDLRTRPLMTRKSLFRMLTPQAGLFGHDPLAPSDARSGHQVGGATTT
jgi:hypothetical protein